MAEVELVIKIPEEVYGYAKKYKASSMLALREMSMCMNAVANAIPLPKGHGRLIDANNITFSQFFDAGDYAQARRGIYEAPTIIEADKESDSE